VGLVVGVVGFGVVGCVDGVVDGFVLDGEPELGADDELDAAELLVDAAGELLAAVDVGVGAGALDEEVSAPAAACCTASVLDALAPPEFDEHPVTPSATTPATAIKAPPVFARAHPRSSPAPEILMPLSTQETGLSLHGEGGENLVVIEEAASQTPQTGTDRRRRRQMTTRLPVE
jgi:hypothetical protein